MTVLPPTLTGSLQDLSPLSISLISTGLILGTLLVTVVYRLWFHPLAHIPGPLLARCSTLWQNYHYIRGTWHDDIRLLHEKYGPVVRINHFDLSFVDADALKLIYGHTSPCKKVSLCSLITPFPTLLGSYIPATSPLGNTTNDRRHGTIVG